MSALPPPERRVVLITGVGRRAGIGFALARRALADGASVMLHSFAPCDSERPWGADPGGVAAVIDELGGASDRLRHVDADLGDPEAPRRAVEATVDAFGAIDALIVNHARDSGQTLETATAEELDLTWAVNARAAVLLTQAFAAVHREDRQNGRVILF
ncbi:MAG TPA: SDR family NAD(P)-dependent oxidoreductase, partial [Solirubrobacterales bacterium]|nr:SDR family NAD(P)-dependent oxidoreductase [Solirubrobacterales bacterium]